MTGLLIFILIVTGLYYLPRLLFPWVMRILGKRMQRQFDKMQNGAANAQPRGTQAPQHEKKVDATVGEYVDYEEIKE